RLLSSERQARKFARKVAESFFRQMLYAARRGLRLPRRRRGTFRRLSKSLVFGMKNRIRQHRQKLWRDRAARQLAPLRSDDGSRRQNDDLVIDNQGIVRRGLRIADCGSSLPPCPVVSLSTHPPVFPALRLRRR